MLEVANALGGAIQVGDSSLWRLPAAQQQPPTSVSPAAASQKQQPPPPQKMRGAEYHTYEEIGRVVTPAAAGEPSSARATAGEAERALGTDTGAERESVRAKPRKSRQKEAADT